MTVDQQWVAREAAKAPALTQEQQRRLRAVLSLRPQAPRRTA